MSREKVEWHSFLAELREGGVYRGHDGMRQYVQDLGDTWEFLHTEIHDTLAVGDVVRAFREPEQVFEAVGLSE